MGAPRTLIVLGGTTEGRAAAAALAGRPGVRVVSSLAGAVRAPSLPDGEVRVGGFGGAGGLAAYLCAGRVAGVLDATHPFAAGMTANAAAACAAAVEPRGPKPPPSIAATEVSVLHFQRRRVSM